MGNCPLLPTQILNIVVRVKTKALSSVIYLLIQRGCEARERQLTRAATVNPREPSQRQVIPEASPVRSATLPRSHLRTRWHLSRESV